MKLHYHGHATWRIDSGSHRVLIDPWFTDNPKADCADAIDRLDAIVVTHAHWDHTTDVEAVQLPFDALEEDALLLVCVLIGVDDVAAVAIEEVGDGRDQALLIGAG